MLFTSRYKNSTFKIRMKLPLTFNDVKKEYPQGNALCL